MAVLGAALLACGDASTTPPAAETPTTVAPGRTFSDELTTTDGYHYKVTVVVDSGSATGGPECPAAAVPGKVFMPITLTVTNEAPDRPAPMPPLRIELTGTAGTKPAQVLVRDPSGTCTFAPRVPQIAPAGSVMFKGSSPAIDQTAAAGSAGRIEVSVSESRFSLASPVP